MIDYGFQALGIIGMVLGAWAKVLLGNRSIWGWVVGAASACCWLAFSLHLGNWLVMCNNTIALALVMRGWCLWIRK